MSAKKKQNNWVRIFLKSGSILKEKKGEEISKTIDVGLLILLELKANPYGWYYKYKIGRMHFKNPVNCLHLLPLVFDFKLSHIQNKQRRQTFNAQVTWKELIRFLW